MLAKFRYSARFMKKNTDLRTCSQIIQPTGIAPSYSCISNSTATNVNNPSQDIVSSANNGNNRSISVHTEIDASFQKSQSIGKLCEKTGTEFQCLKSLNFSPNLRVFIKF